MKFLPYGFGVRYTHEKGFTITNEDVEMKPKCPPGVIPENNVRRSLSRRFPGSVDKSKVKF